MNTLLRSFALLLLLTAEAVAAPVACQAKGVLELGLMKKYQEQIVGGGVIGDNATITIYANIETQTFSILTTTGQITCFVAAGKGWTMIEQKPVISGKDM